MFTTNPRHTGRHAERQTRRMHETTLETMDYGLARTQGQKKRLLRTELMLLGRAVRRVLGLR